MRMEEFLRGNTRRLGPRTALLAGGKRLTFAEIDLMSDRMAAALSANGVAQGERVVLFMDNGREAVVSVFAVFKAGGVLNPVAPSTEATELARSINDCQAAGLITQSRLAAASAAAMADAPSLRLTVIAGCQGSPVIDGILRFEDMVAGSVPCAVAMS